MKIQLVCSVKLETPIYNKKGGDRCSNEFTQKELGIGISPDFVKKIKIINGKSILKSYLMQYSDHDHQKSSSSIG